MTDPKPVMIIKHYSNVWWRRILGFFVPKWGPTKYGVISLTPDGSLEIVRKKAPIVECGGEPDYKALADKINSCVEWDLMDVRTW